MGPLVTARQMSIEGLTEFSGQSLPHSVGTEPTRERRKLKERRVTEGQANLEDREGVTGLWPDDCP